MIAHDLKEVRVLHAATHGNLVTPRTGKPDTPTGAERLVGLAEASSALNKLMASGCSEAVLLSHAVSALATLLDARHGVIRLTHDQDLKDFSYHALDIAQADAMRSAANIYAEFNILQSDTLIRIPARPGSIDDTVPRFGLLSVPLVGNGGLIGRVCIADRYDGQVFDENDELVATNYAYILALTLDKIRDLNQAQKDKQRLECQLRDLRVLHTLAEVINRSASLQHVFEEALVALRWTTGADRAAILLSGQDNSMRFVSWHGLSEAYRQAVEGHNPWRDRTENIEPIAISDPTLDPSLVPFMPILQKEGIASLAFVPLTHQGLLLGKFMLYFDQHHAFESEELRLALTVAEQVSVAVARQIASDEVQSLNASLEDRVRHRTEQLEQANEELEAFSYTISHDLRSPLRALDGFSRILLEEYGTHLDQQAHNHLNRIIGASRRMERMIEDILRLSRVSRLPMALSRVDMSSVAASILERQLNNLPGRNIEINIEPDLLVYADITLIRVVLENLLDNALKYSSRRALSHIELGAEIKNDEMVYFVRDNGVGFDMDHAGRLFSPFRRAHSPGEFEGSGMGLAIVNRIVSRHRGRIWPSASPNQGATFFFTLWDDGVPEELRSEQTSLPL